MAPTSHAGSPGGHDAAMMVSAPPCGSQGRLDGGGFLQGDEGGSAQHRG
jgi:hypothetical protein